MGLFKGLDFLVIEGHDFHSRNVLKQSLDLFFKEAV